MDQKKIDRINELARKSRTAEGLTEEEKAEVITEFKCSLFDDLVIPLEDVFSGLLE